MHILVNYTSDWGMDQVGRYDSREDAARAIAEGIQNTFGVTVDIAEFLMDERSYDNGDFRMDENGVRIWFDNYTCVAESDDLTKEWLIIEV